MQEQETFHHSDPERKLLMRDCRLPADPEEGLKMPNRLFEEKAMYAFVDKYAQEHQLPETRKALSYASELHKDQYRYGEDRVPYIYHPLLMACHLISMGLSEDALLAVCLLHDVCEDCDVDWQDLPFSEEVRQAVHLLTKPKDFDVQDESQEEAYFEAIRTNRIASLVKVTDRCNNVSTMPAVFSEEGMYRYLTETQRWILPLLDATEDQWPQYDKAAFLLRYQILSSLTGVKRILKE